MERTLTAKDVVREAKVDRNLLCRWTDIQIIEPMKDARGRGKVRRYSERNVYEARLCRELHRVGVQLDMMKVVAHQLRKGMFMLRPRESEEAPWFIIDDPWAYLKDHSDTFYWLVVGEPKPYVVDEVPGYKICPDSELGKLINLYFGKTVVAVNLTALVNE